MTAARHFPYAQKYVIIQALYKFKLSIICVVALVGAVFVGSALFKDFQTKNSFHVLLVTGFVIMPFLVEAAGSFGLTQGWFNHWIIGKGKVMEILQWIAGVFGAAAIFDGVMRLFKKVNMPDNAYWFALDLIFLAVFFAWMAVSYSLNENAPPGPVRFRDSHKKC